MAFAGLSAVIRVGLVLGLLNVFELCMSASFYGASHIKFPTKDSSSETQVHLRFRTSRSRGLLFLAAGDSEYCIIELRGGSILVWMDLGAGIVELQSTGVKLNDLLWHNVELSRIQQKANLTIDGVLLATADSPGKSFELTVEEGVFIGGVGSLNKDYIGESDKSFRGCLADVVFNGVDVLKTVQEFLDNDYLKQYVEVQDVTWDCSAEFTAAPNDPISFTDSSSYVTFSRWEAEESGSFGCWLKTHGEKGLLLYNTGEDEDFIAVEIVDGKLRMLLNKGMGTIDFHSNVQINDRKWHKILLRVEESFLEIKVDDQTPEIKTLAGEEGEILELSGPLYIGGVVEKARSMASRQDLASVTGEDDGGSIQGCIREIEINYIANSLEDSRVTHLITAGCVWEYPCTSRQPCIPEAECIESGYAEYECQCNLEVCHKPTEDPTAIIDELDINFSEADSKKKNKKEKKKEKNKDRDKSKKFFALEPLEVLEGGEAMITSDQIKVNGDLADLGLRESQVMFQITREPKFGEIIHDGLRRDGNNDIFTLLDLMGGRIIYIHDGSENFQDRLTFEVNILGNDGELPESLQKDNSFVLKIEISAVNDPPELLLPADSLMQLIVNTKRMISNDVLNVNDPDNDAVNVTYSVLNSIASMGYLENADEPGQSITTFTQEDINLGKIFFVHDGTETKSRLGLRVSDPLDRSDPVSLRIEAVVLELTVSKNSGIKVNPESSVVIKSEELQVVTNAPGQDLAIRFNVFIPPKFGEVQEMTAADWAMVEDFTQRQLDKNKIRYTHSISGSDEMEDSFQLQASCMDVTTEVFSVNVQVMALSIRVVNNTNLILDVIKEKTIIPEHLGSVLVNNIQNNYTIKYTIAMEPEYGHVVRHSVGHLETGDHFTQGDIDAGHIGFRIKHHIRTAVNDTFKFFVSTMGYQSSLFTFTIEYIPDKLSTGVINTGLTVGEGMSKALTVDNLYVDNLLADSFEFTITVPPEHGNLQLLDEESQEVMQWNVKSFTSEELKKGVINYQHDDSETMQDSFKFMAMAVTNEPELKTSDDAIVNGMFNITVEMKNDNKPERVVDKVFKVVENDEKLLTDADLKYTDADIDFDDDNLEYSRQRIANGELVDVNNVSVPVYGFKQSDLRAGKLLFKHKGSSFGRMVFFVYDDNRAKFSSGLLEIEASEPYIDITQNTGLLTQKGKAVMLSADNLTIDTNLNAKDKNIEFFITSSPMHGKLFKKGEGGDLKNFNLEVLKNERIRYQHDDGDSMSDSFNFTIKIKDFEKHGQMQIKIFLKSHQNPPEIGQNRPLVVTEMGVATIKKSHLKASHKDSSPADIVFHVTKQAMNGYLRLLTKESAARLGGGEEQPTSDTAQTTLTYEGSEKDMGVEVDTEFIVSFTQLQINQGRVQYVEMAPGEVSDEFVFEVTNGMTMIRDQVFEIDIIPDIIPLRVKNIEVREGGSKALTEKYVKVNNKHIKNSPVDFLIVKQPTRGRIEHTRMPEVALSTFTTEDVGNEFIYYVHDGSDSAFDQFTIMANASSKKVSDPHVVNVTVTPVNDEPPELVTNKGMEVFTDSVTVVSTDDLSAQDLDTRNEELYFILTNPTNGHMALKSDIKTPILNFTQADIINQQVVFVHNGARTGGFRFQVNDGQNSAKRQIFSITAKPLVVSVVTNTGIDVYPDSVQPITASHLKAVTNEKPEKMSNESITFVVISQPALGKIVKITSQEGSTEYEEVSQFSQEQINQGMIGYKHDRGSSKWNEKDGFVFNVHRQAARNITDQQFHIRISYQNVVGPVKSPLLANTGAKVGEGEAVVITSENLDASNLYAKVEGELENYIIEYNLTKLPIHGVLVINGNNVTRPYVTFQQDDLIRGAVKYIHDHSDTLRDSFEFDVKLGKLGISSVETAVSGDEIADDGNNSNVNLHDSFNLTILPVNDQPFKLLTLAPGMELIQGINKIITREYLETTDPDSPPEEIKYDIIDGPSNGRVALISDHSVALREFTQKHINDEALIFIHNGKKEPGAFYFRVSDGVHKDVYKMFNLNVIPLSLVLANNTGIELPQGDLYAPVTRDNLAARTNGDRSGIMFNVTKPPSRGILLINEQPQTTFSQLDVDNELLAYLQTDKSASEDEFEFVAFNSENVIPAHVFKMTVKAIVKKKHFTLRSGNANHLTTNELDATELANRTLSNPTFEIIQFPQYCQLINAGTSQPIFQFTQRDLVNRNVLVFAEAIQMDNKTNHVQDSMILSLKARNVQPAQVLLPIHIKPVKAKKFPKEDPSGTTETVDVPNEIFESESFPDELDPDDVEQDTNRLNGWVDVSYDSEIPEKGVDPPTTSANNSLEGGPGSSLVDPSSVSGSQLAVIIPIIVLIVLATVVVIVVIWRMRRKDSKPDQVDSPYPEPDEPPLPVVQPQRPPIQGSPGNNPAGAGTSGSPQQAGSPIPSPGITERSPLAPQVTVTPLGMAPGMEDPRMAPNYQNMAGVPGPSGQSVVSLASSGSGIMVYNMQAADPEMAEHCRTSNPTLQKNQYWV
ncbi:chondroitin sulfate proteoglycan 4-like [Ptychodera flava]|uniref:chondroitin sulfate proteoglycan 4-like n=1 Tax=Ptychodera flava TaxID=63121 RepID=UPI003969FC44